MTSLPAFKLERYFAKYEFTTKYMMSCSDPEPFSMKDILDLADDECKRLWDNLSLGYTESPGHPLLRNEIAKMYPGMVEDQVLEIVPQEGIYIAMKVLADLCKRRGHTRPKVVATFPAYQSLYEDLRSHECDVTYWGATLTKTGWYFDLDELKKILCDDISVVVVNFPHNPTGYNPSEEEWYNIVSLCKEKGVYLFSDEMYRMTNNDGTKPLTPACCLYNKAISLSGLSKAFGLPGLRVGWVCTGDKEVLSSMHEFKDYLTICGSAPAEILAIIALRNKDILIQKVVSVIKDNLNYLAEFFIEFKDLFEWCPPRASTAGFPKLKSWTLNMKDYGEGAQGFCDALRKETDILLLPSAMYDYPDIYVRLGFGRKNLNEVLPLFHDFLMKHVEEKG